MYIGTYKSQLYLIYYNSTKKTSYLYCQNTINITKLKQQSTGIVFNDNYTIYTKQKSDEIANIVILPEFTR